MPDNASPDGGWDHTKHVLTHWRTWAGIGVAAVAAVVIPVILGGSWDYTIGLIIGVIGGETVGRVFNGITEGYNA